MDFLVSIANRFSLFIYSGAYHFAWICRFIFSLFVRSSLSACMLLKWCVVALLFWYFSWFNSTEQLTSANHLNLFAPVTFISEILWSIFRCVFFLFCNNFFLKVRVCCTPIISLSLSVLYFSRANKCNENSCICCRLIRTPSFSFVPLSRFFFVSVSVSVFKIYRAMYTFRCFPFTARYRVLLASVNLLNYIV